MHPQQPFRNIWNEDHGTVISAELVSVATIAFIGLIVTLSAMRDATISELSDVAGSVQDLNQSYSVNAATGPSGSKVGSQFVDATDPGDEAEDVLGAIQNGIVFSAPLDESDSTAAPPVSQRFEAEGGEATPTVGGGYADGWIVWSNGQIFVNVDLIEDGIYEFSSRLWGSRGGPDLPNAALLVNGTAIDDFDIVPTSHADAQVYSVETSLPAGTHQFGVAFTNDFYQPPIDRNLFVDWLQIFGPN
jgi:hypothetical protein